MAHVLGAQLVTTWKGFCGKIRKNLPMMSSPFRSRQMHAGALLIFFYPCESVTEFRMSVLSSVEHL